ncbi:Hypothetical protein NG00_01073 [Corynebacterium camporealensis]|uniref:Uncharacterized protein n=1 Tax=Corynebacterium camporealensis TaxID=161896 RepID=A0A0F6QYA4_9CORY|nr:PaaI family thioesterase [Corynebacterium camporealensis]AKE39138.1 hypothetical protein UL81_05870 [Corynebacterium camporealensis]AVH88351.1 Hypothetical protein NG00_01073 [Corynebacterium camporealensis]MDY5840549.1 PaaI family thioesterase [Corynebacterium camporealensis]
MKHLQVLEEMLARARKAPLSEEDLAELEKHNMGLGKTLGMRFTYLGPKEARLVAPVTPDTHQPWGVANGGFYASLAESVASIASVVAGGKPAVGVNNSTDFIKSTSEGEVEAVATPIQLGRRTHLWNIDITQGETLLARSTLRTMLLDA